VTPQVSGRAHLHRGDVGWGHQAAAQEDRHLVGVNFIVLGFAAMKRLPLEGRAQDNGNPFLPPEIREPIPGE
jgi:hypothetical protein